MVFNYSKLKGKIIEKYGTQRRFAEEYGISKQMWSYKIRGHNGMAVKDIIKISEMLGITKDEIGEYFFTV